MRVANNQLLPVVAIGTVVAYVSAVRTKVIDGVRKQKKVRMPIKLTSVYVVPGIAASLFSCKHGFEFNQVGTELKVKLGRAHNREAPEGAKAAAAASTSSIG